MRWDGGVEIETSNLAILDISYVAKISLSEAYIDSRKGQPRLLPNPQWILAVPPWKLTWKKQMAYSAAILYLGWGVGVVHSALSWREILELQAITNGFVQLFFAILLQDRFQTVRYRRGPFPQPRVCLYRMAKKLFSCSCHVRIYANYC